MEEWVEKIWKQRIFTSFKISLYILRYKAMRNSVLLLTLVIFSCQQNKNLKETVTTDFETYPYIPDSLIARSEVLTATKKSADFFNLPVLFNGTKDSLEIRVWPWEAFDWFKNVWVFKFYNDRWTGYHYFSYTMPIIDQDGILMTFTGIKKIGDSVFLVKQITPLCGWQKFSDSLEYFKIRMLPTQILIKNFKHKAIMDGDAVTFEIATKNSYRIIGYSNPSSCQYEECKLVEGFMEMLKRQFRKTFHWQERLYSEK